MLDINVEIEEVDVLLFKKASNTSTLIFFVLISVALMIEKSNCSSFGFSEVTLLTPMELD